MRNKDHIWHRSFPYNFIKKNPTENIICEFHQTLIWMKSRYDSPDTDPDRYQDSDPEAEADLDPDLDPDPMS